MTAQRIINAPSLANCAFTELGAQVEELVQGGADWFHIDIMDGHYVPNLCFPVRIVRELKEKYPQMVTDVHLMVTDPMSYLPLLKDNGADWVSFHMDATHFSRRILTTIRDMGMKAGVVINPSQPISVIEPVIRFVDYVVLMTVEPGYAGQRFMTDSLERLDALIALRKAHDVDFLVSIDGGVDYPNAIECARKGAEVFITGVFTVFRQPDSIADACVRFRQTLASAIAARG
ncbi:ribulose-phosphate 3-epimerase [Propionivibrio dicarboxylicus]|uniref:Ribulose-phosphate 3-epimerase n=1 Tax=Propionivibrio dicarboxylicus TaxID=83767 RepID=A0A1G8N5L6_9RHOO|nr:ribulose-phosphate 3-epimerase [Propionivibrio dicarboxylicus]SDI75482.1 ribulose-phosphate 3-epimerase [Propionivibrio dicarboxylicus]